MVTEQDIESFMIRMGASYRELGRKTWMLRDSEEAAYLGLVAPRYLARIPWNDNTNPAERINFTESIHGEKSSEYLWGSGSMLLARNLANRRRMDTHTQEHRLLTSSVGQTFWSQDQHQVRAIISA